MDGAEIVGGNLVARPNPTAGLGGSKHISTGSRGW